MSTKPGNTFIAKFSFIMGTIIFIHTLIAIIFKIDVDKTPLVMTFLLSVLLFLNGIHPGKEQKVRKSRG